MQGIKIVSVFLLVRGAFAISNGNNLSVLNKSDLKSSDLKVEEARFNNGRDPVLPEYYNGGSSYDRDRYGQNFVTTSYDRYGSSYDRYGSKWDANRDRNSIKTQFNSFPSSNGVGSKYNYIPGGSYNERYGPNYPTTQNTGYGQQYPQSGMGQYPSTYPYEGDQNGIFGQDFGQKDSKSYLLPIAGAALLGIAAALVANPVLLNFGAMHGKRRRRSVSGDDSVHKLVYRGYQSKQTKV